MSNLYKARTQLIYLEEKKGIETLNEPFKQTYAFIDNKPTTR